MALSKTEQAKRKKLIKDLVHSYSIYAERYRTLPLEYQFLLDLKRELKIQPLNEVKNETLDWYPEIPFLRVIDYRKDNHNDVPNMDGLTEWLQDKTTSELHLIMDNIRSLVVENVAYRTLYNWVVDAKYQISHRDSRKSVACGKVRQAKRSSKTSKRIYSED